MNTLAVRSLGELVAEVPGRASVLDRLGLDYCCHGQRSLAEACEAAGLDEMDVSAALAAAEDGPTVEHPTEPLDLIEYILTTHHRYLHAELPELEALAAKVDDVHGERHPELATVRRLVLELSADLEPHMLKEEAVLFPAIIAVADGQRQLPFGTVRNPVRMMMLEHDRAGELLAELRATTAEYEVPADGCASYRSLYERLEHLEADTHIHVHLENNVLFPAAIGFEDAVSNISTRWP